MTKYLEVQFRHWIKSTSESEQTRLKNYKRMVYDAANSYKKMKLKPTEIFG